MSTLEPYTEGMLVSPELRVRISEIMEEKGKAFSQNAIAIRIGMNYETLRKKLRGENKISMFELRRIADALHLTVERLLREDTKELEDELRLIFDSLIDQSKRNEAADKMRWTEKSSIAFSSGNFIDALKHRCLEIAIQLSNTAIGATERSKTLNDLGRAYFHFHKHEEAYSTWLKAFEYAKKLAEKKESDKEPLFHIISNLMISYSSRKEYAQLSAILAEVEPIFKTDHLRSGIIFYSMAKIEENKGNLMEARNNYYQSLNCYELSSHKKYIARSKHNTACFEFRIGSYSESKTLFESALPTFSDDLFETSMCSKEFAKTLIKLGEISEAEAIIQKTLSMLKNAESKEFVTLKGQLLVILSIANNEPKHAESVLELHVDEKVKNIACKFLMDYFSKKGDSQSLMRYYRVSTVLNNSDLLLGEELQ